MLLALLGCQGEVADAEGPCPADMAQVGSALCVDRYEARVDGALGSKDQFASPDAKATAVSAAGQHPSTGVTFSQAWQVCLNPGKRLGTSAEWQDAGDGVVGDGGTAYPYGDAWDPQACVTWERGLDAPLASGSSPACASSFGVDDLVGNLWEWTVGEGRIDVDGWLAERPISERDGLLVSDKAAKDWFVQGTRVDVDPDGVLFLPSNPVWPRAYLRTSGRATSAEELLPVELVAQDDRTVLRLLREVDGRPVPDKRGCGYYTVGNTNCGLDNSSVGDHFHDFDGTIGFRCAVDL